MSEIPDDAIEQVFRLRNEDATQAAAGALGSQITPGMVIHFSGDLGAGKTTFCRALIRSLGYNGRVKSPTFTLVEPYNLKPFPLYHFDFYRFSSGDELRDAGFEEQLDSASVALVEWPERAGNRLPEPDLRCQLRLHETDEAARILVVRAFSERGKRCLNALNAEPSCEQVSPE